MTDDPAARKGQTAHPGDTPEGHTPEDPAPSELGRPGTPGDEAELDHDAAIHADEHAAVSDEDHGHAEERVGPIDWRAWAYAIAGVLAGLVVLIAFYVALV